MASTFRLGGLASGLDSNAIIEQLVSIARGTVTAAETRQAAYKSQITQLGDLTSKLTSLSTAATNIKTSGALSIAQVGTNTGFTSTPSSTATAGRYSVLVDQLATAAKARTAPGAFASGSDQVRGGTLDISINGTTTQIALTDGMSLTAVADAINQSGSGAGAVVLESNGQAFLSITNKNTGFVPGQPPASGLTIVENSTGSLGQPLGLAVTDAKNAKVTIDALQFERASNTIADALPGVTLGLSIEGGPAQDLVLSSDTAGTSTKLTTFLTAYNDVMSILRKNLNIGTQTDRLQTLGGDSAIRGLQSSLMSMVSGIGNPTSSIRSLADLGIKTKSDGTLSIDQARLEKAIATDPTAVNALFQQATDGVSDKVKDLVDSYTNSSDGILVSKSKSYDKSIKQISTQIDALELRLEAYRNKLVAQFTAMEKVVSGFKSIGDYLTSQEARSNK